MPLRVIRDGQGEEVIWDVEEWCQRLPRWWLEPCGCKRKCDINSGILDKLFDIHPFYAKWLLRYGHVSVQGWIVKRSGKDKVELYPWPRKMYRGLGFSKWVK